MTDPTARGPSWRADALAERLAGSRLGAELVVLDEVESTNDEALFRARKGAPEGLLVLAERQTQGRGRGGHAWFSPPYVGVWASFLLRPALPPARLPLLSLAAGLAATRAAERAGAPVGLKWPNDLVSPDGSGKKAGGVLVESRQEEARGLVIVGVGVNVNTVDEEFPQELRGRVTSLASLAGRPVSREDFVVALADELGRAYEMLERGQDARLVEDWKQRAVMFGRPVRVRGGGAEIQGVARDVIEDGSLLVRLDSGVELEVRAGELEVTWQGGQRV